MITTQLPKLETNMSVPSRENLIASSSVQCSDDSTSRGIQAVLPYELQLDAHSRITRGFKRQQSNTAIHLYQQHTAALEEVAMVPLAENLLPYAPPVQSSETLMELIYRLAHRDHKLLVKLLQNLTKTLLDTYCHYGSLIVLDHCEGRFHPLLSLSSLPLLSPPSLSPLTNIIITTLFYSLQLNGTTQPAVTKSTLPLPQSTPWSTKESSKRRT